MEGFLSVIGKAAIVYSWLFTDRHTSLALDITHRCNLRCKHCYFWREEHPSELQDGGMLFLMRRLRKEGLRAAIIYGGEPTLRLDLCRAASGIFDACLIFTNGTHGFPDIGRAKWILSLDGPEKINDEIRGTGVYWEAVNAVKKAARPPLVHMTISRLNKGCVEEFVAAMAELPIDGIGFSFFTPEVGDDSGQCALEPYERDLLLDEILSLRRSYGHIVGMTEAMARQLRSDGDFFSWNNALRCPVHKRVRCFSPDGSPKMCTYGDKADCSKCGCAAVAAYRGAFHPLDMKTLLMVFCLLGMPGSSLLRALLRPPVKKTENKSHARKELFGKMR